MLVLSDFTFQTVSWVGDKQHSSAAFLVVCLTLSPNITTGFCTETSLLFCLSWQYFQWDKMRCYGVTILMFFDH